ncbi:hypothetical protein [Senimuribacter intestinalis]|uniref:hypothetical protein n=1 Tax=Senimuribacter intestinalis TaxID=2941507 RepID=UPI00203DC76E|nr:hypothetical protein [Senimuribacter intestinalis]
MSYKNFVPRVWAKKIQHELERKMVFAEDCNREYEGEVTNIGDTVKILGVGKPTIKTQVGGDIVLTGAEKVESTAVSMPINHIAYFDYMVGDIDKLQATGGIMEALNKESSLGVANEMDKLISEVARDKLAVRFNPTATAITKDNVLSTIDAALVKLYDNDVQPNDEIVMTVKPWFYMILKQAYTALDTDNSKMLENGKVGRYGNVIVKMSNNVAQDTNSNDLVMIRTKKAIAFANPKVHTEPYRPEKAFADAVKGFALYDTKIVRPKELIVLNCKAA